MQNITLKSLQIIESKRMKQSRRRRITLELPEDQTMLFGAVLTAWEDNEMIFDCTLTPQEVQGNNNGINLKPVTDTAEIYISTNSTPTTETTAAPSIYCEFKKKCEEYSGANYYNAIKSLLRVNHLRELENVMSPSMVADVLRCQIYYIDKKTKTPTDFEISKLTHCDNAWLKWQTLFDTFNTEK